MDIVCRLGGFMGSVGKMMRGSGLEEALGTVYGSNAVSHMIALRGHFLVEAALTNKLLVKVCPDYSISQKERLGQVFESLTTRDTN